MEIPSISQVYGRFGDVRCMLEKRGINWLLLSLSTIIVCATSIVVAGCKITVAKISRLFVKALTSYASTFPIASI